jgi:hypothetical protein
MEADWEVEIGAGAPVLDACWSGFIDLRVSPDAAHELPEVQEFLALGQALIRLNAAQSPVWTAKCDVWELTDFDPDELDAPHNRADHALGCYIDLLACNAQDWLAPDQTIAWCKRLCVFLSCVPLRSCRVDLVVRRAIRTYEQTGCGVTAYLAAAGYDAAQASLKLDEALVAFVDTILFESTSEAASKLQ